MDRTYLSDPAVVTASREFVCVRVATYEDEAEAAFAESIFRGRDGLENTVFALLAPDGETKLSRAGRSPQMVFRGESDAATAAAMVEAMNAVAERYSEKAEPIAALPTAMDLRRGLNTAACDLQPIAVLAVADSKDRAKAVERLAKLAWSDEFIGDCQFALVADAAELALLEGLPDGLVDEEGELDKDGGFLLVEPGEFGLAGRVLAHSDANDAKAVRAALTEGLEAFEVTAKDSRQHVRDGRRNGKTWESVVEDQEQPARRRESKRPRGNSGADGG